MDLLVTFLSHIIPVLITMFIVLVAIAFKVGQPYCKYVVLVSQAGADKGQEDLAKYLAQNTGGRKINVDKTWPSFLPAAKDLHEAHVERRREYRG